MANGKPGAPLGNQNARRPNKFREYISEILAEMDEAQDPPRPGSTLDGLLHKYIQDAMVDPEIRKDFLDRVFGKPKQELEHGNSGGTPFAIAWPLPQTKLDQ